MGRKTPCGTKEPDKVYKCIECGRQFASQASANRHTKKWCKGSKEIEVKEPTAAEQMKDMKQQLDQITIILKELPAQTINNNKSITNITNIDLRSWSGDDRIIIPTAILRAAFTENPRLIEYCELGDREKAEISTAEPYVLEALMDLVKRAHIDPAARNIYLNPKRADQVMVFDETTWKVETLANATRSLFDSVAGGVRKIMYKEMNTDKELSTQLKGTACFVPQLYDQEPERFIEKARAPLAAHLTNTAPVGTAIAITI
jgi:DNA-directed RNA polymerase subunit RPC12/RpoP